MVVLLLVRMVVCSLHHLRPTQPEGDVTMYPGMRVFVDVLPVPVEYVNTHSQDGSVAGCAVLARDSFHDRRHVSRQPSRYIAVASPFMNEEARSSPANSQRDPGENIGEVMDFQIQPAESD